MVLVRDLKITVEVHAELVMEVPLVIPHNHG
jgi:hypothetical protein